jgi:hypothetical protein
MPSWRGRRERPSDAARLLSAAPRGRPPRRSGQYADAGTAVVRAALVTTGSRICSVSRNFNCAGAGAASCDCGGCRNPGAVTERLGGAAGAAGTCNGRGAATTSHGRRAAATSHGRRAGSASIAGAAAARASSCPGHRHGGASTGRGGEHARSGSCGDSRDAGAASTVASAAPQTVGHAARAGGTGPGATATAQPLGTRESGRGLRRGAYRPSRSADRAAAGAAGASARKAGPAPPGAGAAGARLSQFRARSGLAR